MRKTGILISLFVLVLTMPCMGRYFDPTIGRWLVPDPLAGKYPNISPYVYCLNNPLKNVDIDGRDVILVVWATDNGRIGHAGIAVSNYNNVNGKMVPNGTYTYKDLWPGTAVGKSNFSEDVPAVYNEITTTSNELLNSDVTGSEGYSPDGGVQLTTDYATDQNVLQAISNHSQNNPNYNGITNNCSDLAKVGVETAAGKKINAAEKLGKNTSSTTPNKLFRATQSLTNAKIIKDPGKKVDNGFIESVTGGGKTQKKAEKRVE